MVLTNELYLKSHKHNPMSTVRRISHCCCYAGVHCPVIHDCYWYSYSTVTRLYCTTKVTMQLLQSATEVSCCMTNCLQFPCAAIATAAARDLISQLEKDRWALSRLQELCHLRLLHESDTHALTSVLGTLTCLKVIS
jgi:hypothetical protein